MASEKQESTSFRAFIEAKIAKWQAVLDAYLAVQETEGADLGAASNTDAARDFGQPMDLPKGAFYGKSVPVCVELYLSAGKVKRTNREIATALKKGGVESNARDFDTVVNGALFGLKKAGKVLRFDDGWGLAEWYPAHIRAVTPTPATGSKKTKKSKKKGKKNPARKATEPAGELGGSPHEKLAVQPTTKPGERVQQLLRSKPGTAYGLDTIAEQVGMGTKFVRLTLGKLVKGGKVVRTPEDMYRSA